MGDMKEIEDLITMESVMYIFLLTTPIGKEWVSMKAVSFFAQSFGLSVVPLTFVPTHLANDPDADQAVCRDHALLHKSFGHSRDSSNSGTS